ncbi:MAG: U32 family peptidase [SAR324 cluster bacterium]|jgi:putative protease|nr:U32 family peptidase [SAR324 cluster bacterium]
MLFNTYLESHAQLKQIQQTAIREVILEHKSLSRMGKLDSKTLLSLLDAALSCGMSTVLQWDILSTEQTFRKNLTILNRLPLAKFDAIRVQDLGAAEWVRQEHPELPLHLIVETGNHNFTGLLRWIEYFGSHLQRLILSTELPKSVLIEYSQNLTVPCEILAVGRILLFYTPRKLLSSNTSSQNYPDFLENKLVPSDQPQRQFPTVENRHGTFMFHHRDLFLLDYLPELKKTDLSVLRLDLRHLDSTTDWIKKLAELLESFDKQKCKALKSIWPAKITHGFFQANRTDLAIERIKNPHLKDHGETLVGYVVEALKGEHLILLARKKFLCGKPLLGITPEGRECDISTNDIQTTDGVTVTEIVSGNLYQVPHVKYVTAQTLVYSLPE